MILIYPRFYGFNTIPIPTRTSVDFFLIECNIESNVRFVKKNKGNISQTICFEIQTELRLKDRVTMMYRTREKENIWVD